MKEKTTWKIWIVLAGVILVVAIILGVLHFRGFFYKSVPFVLSQAKLTSEMREDVQSKLQDRRDRGENVFLGRRLILEKTTELLAKSSNVYVCSWYLLSGNVSSQPAEQSAFYLCEDQILLANAWIELGKKNEAKGLLDAIYKDFCDDQGSLTEMIKIVDGMDNTIITDTYDNFYDRFGAYGRGVRYIDAWLRYYKKWGSGSDWRKIEKLTKELIPIQDIFPEDLYVEGTFKEFIDQASSTAPVEEFFSNSVSLPALMPETLDALAYINEDYPVAAQQADEILMNGQISKELPLYAIGYQNDTDSYFYFNQRENHIDLRASLYTMIELAKKNALDAESILWLKKQLFTSAGFADKYEIVSGTPVQSQEAIECYGITMQIARLVEDDNLYSLSFDKLTNRLATNSQSSVRGAIYRTTEDGRILIRASDNLEAVLGLGE